MAGEVVLIDPQTGLAYKAGGGSSASGPQPAASSTSVTPASDGAAFPVGVANGADVALGNTADTAWSGTGSGTAVSVLKASYNALVAPTPAGTNNIGAVNLGSIVAYTNSAIGLTGGAALNSIGSGAQRALVMWPYLTNGTTSVHASGDTTAAFTKNPPLLGTDRSLTVTTTSQQLMAANTLRVRLMLKNDTATPVFINLGATAVANAGGGNYQIAANGGYFELTGYSGAVNIISTASVAVSAREL